VSFDSVTVKVCDCPTSLVADGAIAIFAFAQSLVASRLSPALPSPLARCRVIPPTFTSVLALIVVVPIVEELIVTVQEPVLPEVLR